MKIQYASDLHLELSGNSRWTKHHPLAVSGDVLILAGDIIYLGDDGGLKHPFWDWCADCFEQTLVVPGNHEYYGGVNLAETLENWNLELRSNVRYLNNAAVRLGHTNIVLSTLWSRIRIENAIAVESGITDFHRIRYGEDRLDFVKFNEAHQKSVDFVRGAVNEAPDDDVIVVSHHLPSQILVSDRFKGSNLNDAFYHRYYREHEPVDIVIEPDFISVSNVGGPDRAVKMEDFESGTPKPRRYRNRRLGDFLKEMDLTEGKSTGITTVRSKLKSNGSPAAIYEFDEERTYFSATVKIHPEFPREGEGQNVPQIVADNVVDELTDRQRDILKLLSHPVADGVVDSNAENASTLAMKLSVTPRTIQRDLAKLQKKGKIVHVGPDNGGHWEVIK